MAASAFFCVKPLTMWGEVWRGEGIPLRQEGAGCCEKNSGLGEGGCLLVRSLRQSARLCRLLPSGRKNE